MFVGYVYHIAWLAPTIAAIAVGMQQ